MSRTALDQTGSRDLAHYAFVLLSNAAVGGSSSQVS